MGQSDLFGGKPHAKPLKPFKDIRNQRNSTAERKAELLLELGELINRCPAAAVNGSVQIVRLWRSRREKAAKVAADKRSSIVDLTREIASMRAPLVLP